MRALSIGELIAWLDVNVNARLFGFWLWLWLPFDRAIRFSLLKPCL
jgi:hypothetical protein